ncbi:T6SS phospholipase effector Tle1-like catalytic domain-containing protein [Aspergillus mulundensis]|uniref:T6SS Phospholipase effector Tle1-like catalytic domain-containing protein n=1 Tax=Aspergillus mulundensis TaxID=1810919 RepID=A0A3D8RSD0_9EURO|nr:hypothetical protein DSM5745_06897 [Aspergillus mulundensis]RDW76905.1 hypothetical protein DSM5745_06897 [Aspergillus mulundensis]
MASMQQQNGLQSSGPAKEPVKLVLCFDGTGNTFSGSNADTNVVKLLSMLDRTHPKQYHYYQTGIGTYSINETSVNKRWFWDKWSTIVRTIDQGYATTFDAHVIAGYRFLMQYYESGAKIYMFGFSRGAYTAKFLARMISTVGLLCKGNEEMVPFAYLLYQRYLAGELHNRTVEQKEELKKAKTLDQLIKTVSIEQFTNGILSQMPTSAGIEKLQVASMSGDQITNLYDQLQRTVTTAPGKLDVSKLTQQLQNTDPTEMASKLFDQLRETIPMEQLTNGAWLDWFKKTFSFRQPAKAKPAVQGPPKLIDVQELEARRDETEQREKDGQAFSGNSIDVDKTKEAFDELKAFSQTFCREETGKDGKGRNIKVYFLGLWDCVSSVAVLEQKAPFPVEVVGTAHYVRHAVAVDERRVKFKAALLAQDILDTKDTDDEDIKEVWFPGGHGDVGGGWPAGDGRRSVADEKRPNPSHWSPWQYMQRLWSLYKLEGPSNTHGAELQMSDIPLAWMIDELELVGQKNPLAAVKWSSKVDRFKRNLHKWFHDKDRFAIGGFVHDSLSFGLGTDFFTVLLWKFLEYWPLTTRWELAWTDSRPLWENVRFPLNEGGSRDMPFDAVLHESVVRRLDQDPLYNPTNCNGRGTSICVRRNNTRPAQESAIDPKHQTYKFAHVALEGTAADLTDRGHHSRWIGLMLVVGVVLLVLAFVLLRSFTFARKRAVLWVLSGLDLDMLAARA